MTVRAIHTAFDVPEHGGAWASIYYAGDPDGLGEARLTGQVAADHSRAPWPVVVIVPGINVVPDAYRWLAVHLVEAGFAAVTYSTIGSLGPAGEGITPGIDMSALAPDVIGSRPSAVALPPLLEALAGLERTPVDGLLDLDRVALVGHSAGGTVALHHTRSDWVPGLRAVVAYAAHTMTARTLGHGEAAVVPIPAQVPVLLVGGVADAVMDQSRDRYTSGSDEHDPMGRTFAEAIDRTSDDCWLVRLAEANHFTLCDPVDTTSGRSFLEPELREDDAETRTVLAELVAAFLRAAVLGADDDEMARLATGDGIATWARR